MQVTMTMEEYKELVNRECQIKDEIIEWSKVVEDLYKSRSINPTAYYTMKGFEVALNNIINKE